MTEKDKLAELQEFLKYDVEVSSLDGHVIDVAMDVISRLIERIKELEKANKTLSDNHLQQKELTQSRVDKFYKLNMRLHRENKCYREALKEIASDDSWETVDEVRSIAYVALESE